MLLEDFYLKILNILSSLDTTSKISLFGCSMDIDYINEKGYKEIIKLSIEDDKLVAALYESRRRYTYRCTAYYEFYNNNGDQFLRNIVENSYNMSVNLGKLNILEEEDFCI